MVFNACLGVFMLVKASLVQGVQFMVVVSADQHNHAQGELLVIHALHAVLEHASST
jgi:hypothetical protein